MSWEIVGFGSLLVAIAIGVYVLTKMIFLWVKKKYDIKIGSIRNRFKGKKEEVIEEEEL